jgi:hypothetical protein
MSNVAWTRAPSRPSFAHVLRPPVGFLHPTEVVKDPHLSPSEKRFILSSWASDARSARSPKP